MNSAVKHCSIQYKKTLVNKSLNKAIHASFVILEEEVKKLNQIDQINLYSIASQLLESLVKQPNDAINALEVFNIRCQSVVGTEDGLLNKICLGLGALVITLAIVSVSLSMGVGIGMLVGFWQLPSAFLASLVALETPAVITTAASMGIGMTASGAAVYSFFQPSKLSKAICNCIEVVKESYLSELGEECEGEYSDIKEDASNEMGLIIHL